MLKKYICNRYMDINQNHVFNMNEILPTKININKYHSTNFDNVNNQNNAAYFCNNKKQNEYNQTIFNRSIFCNSDQLNSNLLLNRPEIKECNGINKNDRTKGSPPKLINPTLPNCCEKSHCVGDKGDPLKYFSSIDVESYVMNIDRKLNNVTLQQ